MRAELTHQSNVVAVQQRLLQLCGLPSLRCHLTVEGIKMERSDECTASRVHLFRRCHATHYSVTSDRTMSGRIVAMWSGSQHSRPGQLTRRSVSLCPLFGPPNLLAAYSLTKSSKPRSVPVNSLLGDFITTQIGLPTHRSTSSRGRICEAAAILSCCAGSDCLYRSEWLP